MMMNNFHLAVRKPQPERRPPFVRSFARSLHAREDDDVDVGVDVGVEGGGGRGEYNYRSRRRRSPFRRDSSHALIAREKGVFLQERVKLSLPLCPSFCKLAKLILAAGAAAAGLLCCC